MKVGYMLMNEPRDSQGRACDWRRFLAEAATWGLEGVDVFQMHLERAGETVEDVVAAVRDLGLQVPVYGIHTDLVSSDPAVRQESLAHVQASADRIAELGIPHLFSHGGQHTHHGEEALARYVDSLQQAADLCAQRGLTLSIENAGSLCHTRDEIAWCLEAVGRANLRLTLDAGNFVLAGDDPHEAVRLLAPQVVHVHVKNFVEAPERQPRPFRYCSPRAGRVDYSSVVAQLRSAGYDGYLAFEPEGFPDARAEDGIRYLAELLASAS